MIVINKNTINGVALTLKEKTKITGTPYFLFVFTNETSQQTKIFTAVEESTHTDRYNYFSITEDENEDLLNGVVHLEGNTSQWTYEIYESVLEFTDVADLVIGTKDLVESGRVQVNGTEGDITINDIYL